MIAYAPYLAPVRLAALPQPRISPVPPKLGLTSSGSGLLDIAGGVVVIGGVAMSTYHGYKRNNSVWWAGWWALMAFLFPIVTPAVAIAQGFGKRARK